MEPLSLLSKVMVSVAEPVARRNVADRATAAAPYRFYFCFSLSDSTEYDKSWCCSDIFPFEFLADDNLNKSDEKT